MKNTGIRNNTAYIVSLLLIAEYVADNAIIMCKYCIGNKIMHPIVDNDNSNTYTLNLSEYDANQFITEPTI